MKNQNIKTTFTERAFRFSITIIKLTEKLPQTKPYWVITDQLIRSTTSIGVNMVEAKSASSKRDYINFYSHALKNANETIYWLQLLKELIQDNTKQVASVSLQITETQELANILAASIITMKKNNRSNL